MSFLGVQVSPQVVVALTLTVFNPVLAVEGQIDPHLLDDQVREGGYLVRLGEVEPFKVPLVVLVVERDGRLGGAEQDTENTAPRPPTA